MKLQRIILPALTLMALAAPSAHAGPTLTTIFSFNNSGGSNPTAGLVLDGQGNLYGTTPSTAFVIAAGTHTLTTLATFSPATTGFSSYSGLTFDGQGNLYGTTSSGGALGGGTVFEIAAGTHAVTYRTFNGSNNGAAPYGPLVLDGQGNFFGTTSSGGAFGYGTVFEIAAGTITPTTIFSFNNTNGSAPKAGLVLDGQGNLYGTTPSTAFVIAAGTHTLTTLATFSPATTGFSSYSGLTFDGQGNLYGTTSSGGALGGGTVFEIAAGTHAVTYRTFNGSNNGAAPYGPLVLDGQGNFFGTTSSGGAFGYGTVFEIAAGTITPTTIFSFNNTNGSAPKAGLVLDGQGNLFGTTSSGGAFGYGSVFEITGAASAVPEPASLLAMAQGAGLALPALAYRARRRRIAGQ